MTGTLGVATLDTLVDLTGLDKGLSEAKSKTNKGLSALAGRTANILTGIVAGGATLAAGAVVGLTVAVANFTLEAAQVEGVKNTFDALVESVGGDTVQAMEQLRAATRGMVADSDLMLAGNKFLAMGIASTTEEAAALAEVATQLGSAMGEDATDSMENFALMLANQSLPRLDSFGISSGRVRERILELMEATEGLTREQAFNMAVMEEAAITMERVGEQGDTAKASMDRIKATLDNAKLTIGQAFLPLLDTLTELVSNKILPFLLEKLDEVMPILKDIGSFFRGFISNIESGMDPLAAIVDSLLTWTNIGENMPMEMFEFIIGLEEKIRELWASITEFLEPIIAFIARWVEWKDVLIVLAAAIAAVVLPIIWSIITAIAPVIAIVVAAIAIVALLRNAWENDWGGIRTFLIDVWENKLKPAFAALQEWLKVNIPIALEILKSFWENTLKPALEDLWAWLQETIPAAIETLVDFWENVLLPAIQDVWAFIQDPFIPLLVALWELIEVAGAVALEVLAGLWENVLLPAIMDVWEWIETKMLPVLRDLWDFLKSRIEPILIGLGGSFDNIKAAVEGVITVIGWLKDQLTNLELPEWLQRGSPAPIELTLSGMAEGLKDAQAQLSGFAMELGGLGGGSTTRIGTNIEQFTLNAPTTAPVDTTVQNVQIALAFAGA